MAGLSDTLPNIQITEVVEIGPLFYALIALLIKELGRIAFEYIIRKYAQRRMDQKDK